MTTRTAPPPAGADECTGSDHPRPFLVGMGAYAALVVVGTTIMAQVDDLLYLVLHRRYR